MIEMAIVLPVFFLIVMGVFVLGSIYSHQIAINTAAREAARMGVVGRPDQMLDDRIRQLTPMLNHDVQRFQVTIDHSNNLVVVSIRYVEKVDIPFLGLLFNNKVLLARAEHRVETSWIER